MSKYYDSKARPPSGGKAEGRNCKGTTRKCRRRDCATCGPVWAGDVQQRFLLSAVGWGGAVALFTITGPGRSVLPHHRTADGWVVDREAARRWNASERARWRKLHRKAAAVTRRKHGSFRIVGQIRAYQKRGLIHRHMLLPGKSPRERAATETYCREIAKRTAEHGYGFTKLGAKLEGRTHKFLDGLRAQGYLVKYVVKEDWAGRPEVLETATHPDTSGQLHYVQPGLSPWTMEAFRRRRRAHVLLREHGCEPLAAHGGRDLTPEAIEGIIARLQELDLPPPAAGGRTDGAARSADRPPARPALR